MKYYLYRHTRLDKNEPFYIGIGKKKKYFTSYTTEYKRAFSKADRNEHWYNITAKTEYDIEIIFESNSKDEINRKEIEFIALYGRKDLGKGTLCNWTNGGDGLDGFKHRDESKQLMRLSAVGKHNGHRNPMYGKSNKYKGIARPKNVRDKISKEVSKPILQINPNGELIQQWPSATIAANILKLHVPLISKVCHGERKTTGGFHWKYVE